MSEFKKVLEKMEENVNAGKWAMDGIQYLTSQGTITEPKWVDMTINHSMGFKKPENYRVKPLLVNTDLFTVEKIKQICDESNCGPSPTWFHSNITESLNEFVEPLLDGIREQAVRDFVEYVKDGNLPWQQMTIHELEVKLLALYPKPLDSLKELPPAPPIAPTRPPIRVMGVLNDSPAAPPAPVYPGSNKPTRRAIQAGDVLIIPDDIEVSKGLCFALRDSSDNAGLNLHRTERTFYFGTLPSNTSITLEEVFNAPNGLQWPEWAKWLEISENSWRFADSGIEGVNYKIKILRS